MSSIWARTGAGGGVYAAALADLLAATTNRYVGGSGGTLAGLLAGLRLVGSRLRPLGIDVGNLWKDFPASVACLASEVCERLGEALAFAPRDVPLVEHTYVGEAYGRSCEAGNAALERLARAEGILLDPVYTAKAFAGLLGEAGRFTRDAPVVFLHTGGVPALFACGTTLPDPGSPT